MFVGASSVTSPFVLWSSSMSWNSLPYSRSVSNSVDAVPDYMAENINVVGTPQEIHAQLVELVANNVDVPLLNMPGGNPDEVLLVSESGIKSPADAQRALEAGANAVLIGEALMRAHDPSREIEAYLALALEG